jgi:hypothetical protein
MGRHLSKASAGIRHGRLASARGNMPELATVSSRASMGRVAYFECLLNCAARNPRSAGRGCVRWDRGCRCTTAAWSWDEVSIRGEVRKRTLTLALTKRAKVFCFFFSKKKCFPPAYRPTSTPAVDIGCDTALGCTVQPGAISEWNFRKLGAEKRPFGRGYGANGVCSQRFWASLGQDDINRMVRQVFF